jgi:formylglycine-generating enzyme required for sulfatase activity
VAVRTTTVVLLLVASCVSTPRIEQSIDAPAMVTIRGPVEFLMGSPPGEVGRNPASDSPDETQHLARIPRSYAIATHEVTAHSSSVFSMRIRR